MNEIKIPGSIFVRRGTNKITIQYKARQIATGLDDTVDNYKQAQKMLVQIWQEDHESINKSGGKTYNDAVQSFGTWAYNNREKKTVIAYYTAIHNIGEPLSFSFASIVEQIKKYLSTANHNTTSKLNILRHYQVFLHYCFDSGWIEDWRIPKTLKPRQTAKEIDPLTIEELMMLISYWVRRDIEFAALLQFLFYTGFRIHEALELEWSSVSEETITKKSKHHTKIISFPITPQIASVLSMLNKDANRVFRWSRASVSPLNKKFNASMQELRIKKAGKSFHSIRKGAISHLINSGVDIGTVSELMDCSIVVLKKHYIKFTNTTLKDAASKLKIEKQA